MINIYITHLIEVGCPTQQVINNKEWKLEYMCIACRDWKSPDPQNAWQSIYTQAPHRLKAEKLAETTFRAKQIDGKSAEIATRKFCHKSE